MDGITARITALSLLSKMFSFPSEDLLEEIVGKQARGLYGEALDALEGMSYRSSRLLRSSLELLGSCDPLDLQREYTRLFITSIGGVPCPPYPSVYLSEKRMVMSEPAEAILELMSKYGLRTAESFKDLPEHVAVVLELASYLLTQAAIEGRAEALGDYISLLENMEAWVRPFAQCVIEKSREEFYRVAAAALDQFVLDELKFTRNKGGREGDDGFT